MPKAKNEQAESLSNSERGKRQRLYKEGKVAYGSVQNLQKASWLSKKKDTDFLYRKNSYTKFGQAMRHFRRLSAFAKCINEIWCLDLAFMDKLSEFNNVVKYLLICVDSFSRLVHAQSMKSKYASEAVAAFKKRERRTLNLIECGLIKVLSLRETSKHFARVKTAKSTLQEVKQRLL